MTKTEKERLTRMEDNQEAFTKSIEKFDKRLEALEEKLDSLNSKFDNLTGGKQALMWVTGIALSIFGLIAAYLNILKDK